MHFAGLMFLTFYHQAKAIAKFVRGGKCYHDGTDVGRKCIVNLHSSSVFEKSDSNTNFQDEKRITNTRYPRTSLADPNPARRARCPGGNLEPKAISGAGSERGRELYYCIDDATGKWVWGLVIHFSIRLQQNLNFPRP